jgi:hypothetical protein
VRRLRGAETCLIVERPILGRMGSTCFGVPSWSDRLRPLIERWEDLPHNAPGVDESWVERIDRESREHWRAVLIAPPVAR